MDPAQAAKAKAVIVKVVESEGLPTTFINLAMLQLAHETGGFKSKISRVNNLSGIKYSVNGYGRNSGILPPKNEGPTPYAAYDTLELWAKDYLRILKKSNAHRATSIEDFASRLKSKGYFTDTLSNYTKALKSWQPQISRLPTISTGGTISILLIVIVISSIIILYK